MQLGHALGELGQAEAAEGAYRQAIALNDHDAWLHIGNALRAQSRTAEAAAAYSRALENKPESLEIVRSLIALGATEHLSYATMGAIRQTLLDRRASLLSQLEETELDIARAGIVPLQDYATFRDEHSVPAAPLARDLTIHVLIDARGAVPAFLKSTLTSLKAQKIESWTAWILATQDISAHPIASEALIDERFHFVDEMDDIAHLRGGNVLLLQAGVTFDPQALAWLAFAVETFDSGMLYADHDHGIERWSSSVLRSDPHLYWTHDRYFLADCKEGPAFLWLKEFGADALSELIRTSVDQVIRSHTTSSAGGLHIPLILSTIISLPELAERGLPDPAVPDRNRAAPAPQFDAGPERIAVVIPTRDSLGMLQCAIDSIQKRARQPNLLDIVIVDNRSCQDDIKSYFASNARHPTFCVIDFDEPFNWSRANNLACRYLTQDIVVFANNDIEMLTDGWDDAIRIDLQDLQVGVVGARLLYADETVQHGGIVFGQGEGLPLHEAMKRARTEEGPSGRFKTKHRTAAVTGAFFSIRRELFKSIGGFNEELAVAYNDVELCFRLRSAGYAILYQPAIELFHFESATRGQNTTRSDIAWDHRERMGLSMLYPSAMAHDPSVNPQWAKPPPPFTALRDPPLSQIVDYMIRGSRADPWAP
nr:glycosyltransferase [Sphingomonas vulcanisoli]